ncbi:glycoside hydrolase family 25 protein [Flavonifractor sp. An100]|uniref:glycoside hydrolase family 25 protein n=1 Tax=Flavonifractor sp. An100 TaxID=1965538 RepID=UPI000B368176|nr:glycoside hydrolase family 25 protein [Flavonifractor sp. An100]OUQ82273.1 hypothetical protein B5E43_00390 [Flavonifractor sp. An100]
MSEQVQQYPQPEQRGPGRRQKKSGWMGKTALVCSILALVLAGTALFFVLWERPPVTFQYRDMTLEAKEGVPVNAYAPDGFYLDELGRVRYRQGDEEAKVGIDVSFYQGEIDWQQVAADGVEFAIIRLGYRGYTEGNLRLDSRFEENIRGALEAGLEVGVYFFSQAITPQEAEEEAAFVTHALESYSIAYPVVFDWEFITSGGPARSDGMDGLQLTECALAFCQVVEKAGYTPMVYLNQEMGYFTYDLAQMAGIPLWLAEYDSKPDFYYHFDLWQYTHTGTVAGIEGSVDWNLDFRGLSQTTK